jgi:(R,R)-butanediol dehydrogenase / meso-butanediol dehydrogenase / diacetyl reductase
MKAAVFKAVGQPLEIVELPDPTPGPGEIVIRVRDCGICGSDLHAATNRDAKLPPDAIMGHEFAGIVESVGDEVTGFETGDAVAAMSYMPCGECASCRAGLGVQCAAMRLIGFGDVPGGYAELVKLRPGGVFKLPRTMSFRLGAMAEPMVAGFHGLRRSGLQAGETCVIMGAGPMGLMPLLWARFAGARAIVVAEFQLHRRDLALKLGADAAVDPRMHNPAAAMARISGTGPDVVFECIGQPGTLAQAITMARRGGRVTVLGVTMEEDGFAPGIAMNKELDIRYSLGTEAGEADAAIAIMASGRVNLDPLITHVAGLEDLPRAFSALSRPHNQCKVLLEF